MRELRSGVEGYVYTDIRNNSESFHIYKDQLLTYFTSDEKIDYWLEKFPQVSKANIRTIFANVHASVQRAERILYQQEYYIDAVLRSLNRVQLEINKVLSRCTSPDENQIELWKKQFPDLDLEEVKAHFSAWAQEQLQRRIQVTESFSILAEVELQRKYPEKNKKEGKKNSKNHQELTQLPPYAFLVMTEFFKNILKSFPLLAPSLTCSLWCAVVQELNPSSFRDPDFYESVVTLLLRFGIPTLVLLSIIHKTKESVQDRQTVYAKYLEETKKSE